MEQHSQQPKTEMIQYQKDFTLERSHIVQKSFLLLFSNEYISLTCQWNFRKILKSILSLGLLHKSVLNNKSLEISHRHVQVHCYFSNTTPRFVTKQP